VRSNTLTKIESSPAPIIPLPGDTHQNLIAGAQDFLDHTLGEVTPKMLTYLERKLSELTEDLADLRSLMSARYSEVS
jgi:hypothetical protein